MQIAGKIARAIMLIVLCTIVPYAVTALFASDVNSHNWSHTTGMVHAGFSALFAALTSIYFHNKGWI